MATRKQPVWYAGTASLRACTLAHVPWAAHPHTSEQVFNSGGKVTPVKAWHQAGQPGSSKAAALQSIRKLTRSLRDKADESTVSKGCRPHTYNTQPTSHAAHVPMLVPISQRSSTSQGIHLHTHCHQHRYQRIAACVEHQPQAQFCASASANRQSTRDELTPDFLHTCLLAY